jgi:hypothetical protein
MKDIYKFSYYHYHTRTCFNLQYFKCLLYSFPFIHLSLTHTFHQFHFTFSHPFLIFFFNKDTTADTRCRESLFNVEKEKRAFVESWDICECRKHKKICIFFSRNLIRELSLSLPFLNIWQRENEYELKFLISVTSHPFFCT